MLTGWLLLHACSQATFEGRAAAPRLARDADSVADTGTDDTGTLAEESVGDQPGGDHAAWLFGLDTLHTVDIEVDDAAWDEFGADPHTYVEGNVVVDGERVDTVGVRLRGKIGSLRALYQKPKFRVDFNQYNEDQRFYGLESLTLNNSVVDCSSLKEVVGYEAFRAAGVPAPRTGYAQVTVNGADYGLYTIIETPDDRFLERTYADGTGNLYDGKYVWYGGGSYTLLDFAIGVDTLYELEEGTDVQNADIAAVSSAISANWGTGTWNDGVGAVVDWEEVHRHVAVEQWVGHLDGYTLNTNNYRVYFDPADGKADILPYDLDYAFLTDSTWGMSWGSPRGTLVYGCYADAACLAEHKLAVADVIDAIDAADLSAVLAEAALLTEAATAADPRRECDAASVATYRADLSTWVAGQSAAMRSWWGL